jgi:predicted dinucleotide-utilizing enzyme
VSNDNEQLGAVLARGRDVMTALRHRELREIMETLSKKLARETGHESTAFVLVVNAGDVAQAVRNVPQDAAAVMLGELLQRWQTPDTEKN